MRTILIILIGFLTLQTHAQRKSETLHLSGSVFGYDYDPAGFFKKEKVAIQGSLAAVDITVKTASGKTVKQVKSGDGGDFSLYLPLGKIYTVSYTKSDYGKSAFDIDCRLPEDMTKSGVILENIELILNDNETDKAIDVGRSFAKIIYDLKQRKFVGSYHEFSKNERLFKKLENSTPVNLLKTSLSKNADANKDPSASSEESNETTQDTTSTFAPVDGGQNKSNSIAVLSNKTFKKVADWKNITKGDIDKRAQEISEAWEQLEKDKLIAVTEEDFLIIQAREQMLIAAEEQLAAAELYLDEQESKLRAQNNVIYALGALLLLVGIFVFFLIRSNKEKKKANEELDKRNKRITASITYAERIQRSVLLKDAQIKKLFPESFVFYKPLDIVSGDFYWFSEVGNKTIVAAIDCTGHGVPGAFMSLIANTLMNQIVNEKKITEPAKILKALHDGIVESLQQEEDIESAQDGMDLSVCTYDKSSRMLTFSGAMNPIYLVHQGEITELSANLRGVGGILRRKRPRPVIFDQEEVKVAEGTNLYLFSDGFMDQFGGSDKEKFNITRFKSMLLEMHTEEPAKQKEIAQKALKNWQGSHQQIDDVLLIGIKF